MEPTIFFNFLLAIALWGLIGIERELPWAGTKPGGATGFWGIRTFASIAFLWAIAGWLDSQYQSHIWVIFGAVMSGLFILLSYGYSAFSVNKMGATSEYAALITYFLWVISMMGHYIVAVILAIFLLLLLSAKGYLTKLKTRLSRQELGDSLKFAVIALVILPLLPDVKYSFLDIANWFYAGGLDWTHPTLTKDFFNPQGIWKFVVIMAWVEYAWYLLAKVIWNKWGIIASGALWWMISSTAVTVAMTKKSKEHPWYSNSYVVATLLASCIMFIRVVVVSFFVFPKTLESILIPWGVMFLGLVGMTLYYYLQAKKTEANQEQVGEKSESEYESPFQLLPAIQFAGLIVMIKYFAILWDIYKNQVPPEVSNYFLGLISGIGDVDAINLTMSEMARDGNLPLFIATTTILIAVISNNSVKASIAYRFGEKSFGRRVIAGFWVSIFAWIVTIGALTLFSL